MALPAALYDSLSACFAYPAEDTTAQAIRCAQELGLRSESGCADEAGALASALLELASWTAAAGQATAEERYTQLFDLKPVCTLNLTHHLLGDTYQRGAVLAGLAQELNLAEIDHGADLPDHLPVMLRLLSRIPQADRVILVHTLMLPGLKKVLVALEESKGAYPPLLRALEALLRADIPVGDEEIPVIRRPLEVLPCSM